MTENDTAVPEGMKAWAGGDSAPEDWDGGLVCWDVSPGYTRVGEKLFEHPWQHGVVGWFDIIAYTPRPSPPSPGAGLVEADVEAACERSWDVTHCVLWRHLTESAREPWRRAIRAALNAKPTATVQSDDALREALKPFAAMADEWDRWQAKGSTSTPAMVRLGYGKCQIGLPEYQAARAALVQS